MLNRQAVNDCLLNKGLARLAGTSSAVVTTTGHFGLFVSGSATGTATGSGTLTLRVPLGGSATGTVTTAADLQRLVYYWPSAIDGSAWNTRAVNAPNPNNLAGTATCVVTTTGVLSRLVPLAGTATGVVIATSPGISGTNKLDGTATVTITTSAALFQNSVLQAAATLAATVNGALQLETPLSAEAILTALGVGSLSKQNTGSVLSLVDPATITLTVSLSQVQVSATGQTNVAATTDDVYANAHQ